MIPDKKQCTKCKCIFPLNAESFHRDKQSPDGFFPRCKLCRAEYLAGWRSTEKGKAWHRRCIERQLQQYAERRALRQA